MLECNVTRYILEREETGDYFIGLSFEPPYVKVTGGLCLARMWKQKEKARKMALRLEGSNLCFVVREIYIETNGDIKLVGERDG